MYYIKLFRLTLGTFAYSYYNLEVIAQFNRWLPS